MRDPDSRPVGRVSWHEALAYCDWLSDELSTSPVLAQSETARLVRERQWRVALPSELEWEKAARGRLPDAVFSWGDTPDPNRANYNDSGIGDTSAVGCFPANDFGLYDMIGNVWEWTRSLGGKDWVTPDFVYPYRAADGREDLDATDDVSRVGRGGPWVENRVFVRCAFRLRMLPVDRNFDIGFRVVLRSAPVP